MKFKGLFIGIDRYASSSINWLNCAKRDAVALHALFTDTLGGDTKLLVDENATRSNIENEFKKLAESETDDVVVVSFSGHGTPTHELVVYDSDRRDFAATGISLDLLTQWFFRIPSKNIIFILDCCFSGGMGARVVQVDNISRNTQSTENLLGQLSGEGRLILTASLATEPSWENQKLRHGLLTYYLLEAMQGVEEVKRSGKISIYKLLEYVTSKVVVAAQGFGKSQKPTLRGSIDGNISWPIFKPGTLFKAAFPERVRPTVTADIRSLSGYNFSQPLLDIWSNTIPSLNQLQIDAINEFNLLEGEHLVISAPTSSGKTMIGELAALKGINERKRALFLFPLKALVNDKHRYFNRVYGSFGIRTIRATGESTSDEIVPLMRGQYDICLMTYEKFSAIVLNSPYILEQVGTIVIDEAQMIADKSRGINLEFILTLLKLHRRKGIEPQLIALSAVIGDMNGFDQWLGARLLFRDQRPVPLKEGIINANGDFRFISPTDRSTETVNSYIQPEYRKNSSQDVIIPLVKKLVAEGKQVIVFRETKAEARSCALYLAKELGLAPAQLLIDSLPSSDPSLPSERLREALLGGVAFHTADLQPEERLLVEEHYRTRGTPLRVIAATTTLAMGVNTPAEAVIVAGLKHPSGPYSVAEYKNMVGRAGRLGHAEEGTSFLVALTSSEESQKWDHYVLGSPEDLESQFFSREHDPRSIILRVLATTKKIGMKAEEITAFIEDSFGAFQEKQLNPNWSWDRPILVQAISSLQTHSLIKLDEHGIYHLTKLGRLTGEAGVEVESIIRLMEAFSGIDPETINDPSLITAAQLTVELDQINFPLNRKSTQKEPDTWLGEIQRQGMPSSVTQSLHRSITEEYQPTMRAKKAAACLLWITDKPLAQIEEVLTQYGGKFDGAAGPMRSLKDRTCDLLPVVAQVAQILHPGLNFGERLSRLLTRLELGVPAPITNLAMYVGNELNRGDYLNLLKAGFHDIDIVDKIPDSELLQYVENNQNKVSAVRNGILKYRQQKTNDNAQQLPILPVYEY